MMPTNVIRIDRIKIRRIREIRNGIEKFNEKVFDLINEHSRLLRDSMGKEIDLLLTKVYIINRKIVCGDCLTDDELLHLLTGSASFIHYKDNPTNLKCTRCGETCRPD
jgi:hypothetical protein